MVLHCGVSCVTGPQSAGYNASRFEPDPIQPAVTPKCRSGIETRCVLVELRVGYTTGQLRRFHSFLVWFRSGITNRLASIITVNGTV
jgi:hypothetical protein